MTQPPVSDAFTLQYSPGLLGQGSLESVALYPQHDWPCSEPLEKVLGRIRSSAQPQSRKKSGKGSAHGPGNGGNLPNSDSELFVGLYSGNSSERQLLEGGMANGEAWLQGRVLVLGEESFAVVRNPPLVNSLMLPVPPMQGFPLLPIAEMENADADACTWRWYRKVQEPTAAEDEASWQLVHEGRMYTTQEDPGTVLRVECVPGRWHRDGGTANNSESCSWGCEQAAASLSRAELEQRSKDGMSGKETEDACPQGAGVVATEEEEMSSDVICAKPRSLLEKTALFFVTGSRGILRSRMQADVVQYAALAESLELPPVALGPGSLGVEERHRRTPGPLAQGIRVVTYNILAAQYADRAHAREVLFRHCPAAFLDVQYRAQLVLQELLGFHADVICLQEVDVKLYERYYEPMMAEAGYCGRYLNKAGQVSEGEATFWRRSRYRLRAVKAGLFCSGMLSVDVVSEAESPGGNPSCRTNYFVEVMIRDVFGGEDLPPSLAALQPMLDAQPEIAAGLKHVSTVGLIVLLDPVPVVLEGSGGDADPEAACRTGLPLCVVNTHLFYHARASHIRTASVAALAHAAHGLLQGDDEAAQPCKDATGWGGSGIPSCSGDGPSAPTLLFCGDLNSDLNDGMPGALALLRSGRLPRQWWDWGSASAFRWSQDEESGEPGADEAATSSHADTAAAPGASPGPGPSGTASVDLEIPFRLRCAGDFAAKYTNYVPGFSGLLDFVWYQEERVAVVQEVELPSDEQLLGYLPSQRFPSDHLPVVFDLSFLPASQQGPAPPPPLPAPDATAAGDGSNRAMAQLEGRLMQAVPEHAGLAAAMLRQGKVVAMPTDTIYGLACRADAASCIDLLYHIKGRSFQQPLSVCVASVAQIGALGDATQLASGLLDRLLPGPVTVLLRRLPCSSLAPQLNPGFDTIGIRVPDQGFICTALKGVPFPIALTSANRSSETSPLVPEDFELLWPQCAAVFDGGRASNSRAGSTIVDLSVPGRYRIVRPGSALEPTVAILESEFGLVPASDAPSKAAIPGKQRG